MQSAGEILLDAVTPAVIIFGGALGVYLRPVISPGWGPPGESEYVFGRWNRRFSITHKFLLEIRFDASRIFRMELKYLTVPVGISCIFGQLYFAAVRPQHCFNEPHYIKSLAPGNPLSALTKSAYDSLSAVNSNIPDLFSYNSPRLDDFAPHLRFKNTQVTSA